MDITTFTEQPTFEFHYSAANDNFYTGKIRLTSEDQIRFEEVPPPWQQFTL